LWTELLLRAAIGGDHHPGMSRPYRHAVKDDALVHAGFAI